MYNKFKELVIKKDRGELGKFVESSSADELSGMITTRICNSDVPRTLRELLQAFPDSESSQTKRRKIVEAVLKTLRNAAVSNSHADSIVDSIVIEFPRYTKLDLVKLVEFCHERICLNDDDFTSWKDILPVALEVLQEEKYINYKGNEVSGPEYKSLIVKSICNNQWESAIVTSLAKMFGEMSVEKNDHETIIKGLCDKLLDTELNEIPPLVHQMLRLCSSHDSRILLGTLQKYFASKYSASGDGEEKESFVEIESGVVLLKEIQETESTVFYHIYQAAQLNHASLKDFISSLKRVTNAPECILDPFLMAVLLLLSNIYEDQIFDILKMAMRRKIQDDEKRKKSAWLREVLSDDSSIDGVVKQVIANSNKDRHLVLKGLIDLAFVLMNSDRRLKEEDNRLYEIGIGIVQKLIRKRHEIGSTVLQKLTEKIVGGGSMISQYTDCLSYICRKLTLIVLDCQVWVKMLLEQLLEIPGDAATKVLHATLPLMRVSASIRDTLVLLLRKALYRKGTYTRQMAVIGFLELLKNLKTNHLTALSQSSNSSASSSASIFTQVTLERRTEAAKPNARCNAALCHEVLSILKRCFSHEVDVRLHLYKGLCDAVSMNPELSEYVMDMLIAHFNIYYESDLNVKPALKFHLCTDIHGREAVLEEPIGDLIFVMQKIYIQMASRSSPSLDKVAVILESLCRRMAQTELEHLNLDDRSDLLDNVPKSQQKLHALKLMITVYEALMAYRICGWSLESVNAAQSLNSLFKGYNELVQFSKRVTKPKVKSDSKSKKERTSNDDTGLRTKGRASGIVKLPNTIMDLETIHKILSLLYKPTVPWATKEQAAFLKKRPEFQHYILQTAIRLFQNAKTLRNNELGSQRKCIKEYLDIAELLYKQILSDFDNVRTFDQLTAVLGLECFKELCDLVCTSFASDLAKFLGRTCEIDESMGISEQILGLIKTLQVLLEAFFREDIGDEVIPKKIPIILLDTMSILLHNTSFANAKTNAVFDWLKKLARTTDVETPIALIFVELLTMIEERDTNYGETLDELCTDICNKLGQIEETETSTNDGDGGDGGGGGGGGGTWKCLTAVSSTQAHGILSSAVSCKLSNSVWLLDRLKAEQTIASASGLGDETHREKLQEKERCLCRQLSFIMRTFQILSNANVEPGPNTDATFKNFQRLYHTMSQLTKHFFGKSSAQNPAFQSVRFVQVVKLAGDPLKICLYNLILHTENNQNNRRAKSDTHAQRNKVLKETKLIPTVIYEIEQFNKEIIALTRKTRTNLDTHIKHSTNRGFRIKNPELIECLEKQDVSLVITQNTTNRATLRHDESSSNSSNGDSEDDENEGAPPPAKIPRLDDSP